MDSDIEVSLDAWDAAASRDLDTALRELREAELRSFEMRMVWMSANAEQRTATHDAVLAAEQRVCDLFVGQQRTITHLRASNERLQGVITQHDLCHDLHGKVDANDFAHACAVEQRRIYGRAPHADMMPAFLAEHEAAQKVKAVGLSGHCVLVNPDALGKLRDAVDRVEATRAYLRGLITCL